MASDFSTITIAGINVDVDPTTMMLARTAAVGKYRTSSAAAMTSVSMGKIVSGTLSVSGAMLKIADANLLLEKAKSRSVVTVSLVPGNFIVRSVTRAPSSPGVKVGDEASITVRCSYTINFEEV